MEYLNFASILSILLLILGFSLIVFELISGGSTFFDLLISGVGLITGGIAGILSGDVIIALLTATVCVLGYWLILRIWLHDWLKKNTIGTASKLDQLAGTTTKIIRESADGKKHFVKIHGEEWLLDVEESAKVGQKVIIEAQKGTKLIAKIIKEN